MRLLLAILPALLLCAPVAEAKKKAKPAPPPPAKPIPAEFQNSVCTITTSNSSGTGFVATFKGKTVIATNQHVIFGQKNIRIVNSQGNEFKPSGGLIASEADVALLFITDPLPEGVKPFVMSENIASIVKLGDEITIVGNSLGGGTLTVTGGHVKFLGPLRIEHDAPTFRGNSGSPIYHHNSGQVIGVDTESVLGLFRGDDLDAATSKAAGAVLKGDSVRLFGQRADTEKTWLNLDWKSINAVQEQLDKIDLAIQDAELILNKGNFTKVQDEFLRKKFEEWSLKMKSSSSSDTEAYNIFIKAVESSRTSLDFKVKQVEPLIKAGRHRQDFNEYKAIAAAYSKGLDLLKEDTILMRAMYAGKYKMPEKIRVILYSDGTTRVVK